ncbi:MAG: ROK family protein, partial [Candidatus Omnitrophica bacterium]|nr:ROK family protein [Candidatus Omnitrophota bacterium]
MIKFLYAAIRYVEDIGKPLSKSMILTICLPVNVILMAKDARQNNKQRRISAFGKLRGFTKEDVPALLKNLKEGDDFTRRVARKILYNMRTLPLETQVEILILNLAESHYAGARKSSIKKLVRLQRATGKILPFLTQALEDKNVFVRAGAAQALKNIGNDAAVDEIILVLLRTIEKIYAEVADAFDKSAVVAGESVGSLAEVLGDEYGRLRKDALEIITRAFIVECFVLGLKRESLEDRYFAANALGKMGKTASRAVPYLVEIVLFNNLLSWSPKGLQERDIREAARNAIKRICARDVSDRIFHHIHDVQERQWCEWKKTHSGEWSGAGGGDPNYDDNPEMDAETSGGSLSYDVREKLLEIFGPDGALIGSQAQGTAGPDSDIDINLLGERFVHPRAAERQYPFIMELRRRAEQTTGKKVDVAFDASENIERKGGKYLGDIQDPHRAKDPVNPPSEAQIQGDLAKSQEKIKSLVFIDSVNDAIRLVANKDPLVTKALELIRDTIEIRAGPFTYIYGTYRENILYLDESILPNEDLSKDNLPLVLTFIHEARVIAYTQACDQENEAFAQECIAELLVSMHAAETNFKILLQQTVALLEYYRFVSTEEELNQLKEKIDFFSLALFQLIQDIKAVPVFTNYVETVAELEYVLRETYEAAGGQILSLGTKKIIARGLQRMFELCHAIDEDEENFLSATAQGILEFFDSMLRTYQEGVKVMAFKSDPVTVERVTLEIIKIHRAVLDAQSMLTLQDPGIKQEFIDLETSFEKLSDSFNALMNSYWSMRIEQAESSLRAFRQTAIHVLPTENNNSKRSKAIDILNAIESAFREVDYTDASFNDGLLDKLEQAQINLNQLGRSALFNPHATFLDYIRDLRVRLESDIRALKIKKSDIQLMKRIEHTTVSLCSLDYEYDDAISADRIRRIIRQESQDAVYFIQNFFEGAQNHGIAMRPFITQLASACEEIDSLYQSIVPVEELSERVIALIRSIFVEAKKLVVQMCQMSDNESIELYREMQARLRTLEITSPADPHRAKDQKNLPCEAQVNTDIAWAKEIEKSEYLRASINEAILLAKARDNLVVSMLVRIKDVMRIYSHPFSFIWAAVRSNILYLDKSLLEDTENHRELLLTLLHEASLMAYPRNTDQENENFAYECFYVNSIRLIARLSDEGYSSEMMEALNRDLPVAYNPLLSATLYACFNSPARLQSAFQEMAGYGFRDSVLVEWKLIRFLDRLSRLDDGLMLNDNLTGFAILAQLHTSEGVRQAAIRTLAVANSSKTFDIGRALEQVVHAEETSLFCKMLAIQGLRHKGLFDRLITVLQKNEIAYLRAETIRQIAHCMLPESFVTIMPFVFSDNALIASAAEQALRTLGDPHNAIIAGYLSGTEDDRVQRSATETFQYLVDLAIGTTQGIEYASSFNTVNVDSQDTARAGYSNVEKQDEQGKSLDNGGSLECKFEYVVTNLEIGTVPVSYRESTVALEHLASGSSLSQRLHEEMDRVGIEHDSAHIRASDIIQNADKALTKSLDKRSQKENTLVKIAYTGMKRLARVLLAKILPGQAEKNIRLVLVGGVVSGAGKQYQEGLSRYMDAMSPADNRIEVVVSNLGDARAIAGAVGYARYVLGVKTDKPYAVGIDMGGTNMRIALVNLNTMQVEGDIYKLPIFTDESDKQCMESLSRQLQQNSVGMNFGDLPIGIENYLPQNSDRELHAKLAGVIYDQLTRLIQSVDLNEVGFIALASPGIFDREGPVKLAYNLPFTSVEVRKELAVRFSLPIYMGNDVACAGLGEFISGSGRGLEQIFVLNIGTGLNMCLVQKKDVSSQSSDSILSAQESDTFLDNGGRSLSTARPWNNKVKIVGRIIAHKPHFALNQDGLLNVIETQHPGLLEGSSLEKKQRALDYLLPSCMNYYYHLTGVKSAALIAQFCFYGEIGYAKGNLTCGIGAAQDYEWAWYKDIEKLDNGEPAYVVFCAPNVLFKTIIENGTGPQWVSLSRVSKVPAFPEDMRLALRSHNIHHWTGITLEAHLDTLKEQKKLGCLLPAFIDVEETLMVNSQETYLKKPFDGSEFQAILQSYTAQEKHYQALDNGGSLAVFGTAEHDRLNLLRHLEDETIDKDSLLYQVASFISDFDPSLQRALKLGTMQEVYCCQTYNFEQMSVYPFLCNYACVIARYILLGVFGDKISVTIASGQHSSQLKERNQHHAWLELDIDASTYYLSFVDGQFVSFDGGKDYIGVKSATHKLTQVTNPEFLRYLEDKKLDRAVFAQLEIDTLQHLGMEREDVSNNFVPAPSFMLPTPEQTASVAQHVPQKYWPYLDAATALRLPSAMAPDASCKERQGYLGNLIIPEHMQFIEPLIAQGRWT